MVSPPCTCRRSVTVPTSFFKVVVKRRLKMGLDSSSDQRSLSTASFIKVAWMGDKR